MECLLDYGIGRRNRNVLGDIISVELQKAQIEKVLENMFKPGEIDY